MDNFLEALKELCNKYQVVITGCGCCGSPFLYWKHEMEAHGGITNKDGKECDFETKVNETIEHLRG